MAPSVLSSLPIASDWLDRLPNPVYLVGGSVRNWLLKEHLGWDPDGSMGKLDLDLVVEGDALQWAANLARYLQGGYVVLDEQRHIARVVLPDLTLDIAQQAGSSLEADLYQRDFTCNAIALELHSGKRLDPLEGYADLCQHRLRMVHPDNLTADPLRLLRAYRQAAQLRFDLDPPTQEAIRQRGSLLQQVAGERVRTEISYLLAKQQQGLYWLGQAWSDGILTDWLPFLSAASFQVAEQAMSRLPELSANYASSFLPLQHPLTDQRTGLITLWLAALCLPEGISLAEMDAALLHLKYSRIERQWMQKLKTLTPQLQTLAIAAPPASQIYLFFQAAGSLFPAIALLAHAYGLSACHLIPWLERYHNPHDRLAHPVALLDGHQLIEFLGLPSGRWVGSLLTAIRLAQATGEIQTQEEALGYAQAWVTNPANQGSLLQNRQKT
ncbi:MAG: CCA tRNA nucleotidyltransferase [Cyanobacteriota bacterium]|nr:CCA tRNA nucleotidyltransferase [Cyanobacteriota bacterium]